ncbi:hypothetical protein AcW1_001675 [Taiwanofungus camphoratus]|nr:hypothetical protein AcV5_000281 [Antrodia cinnamomea]KAI0944843.1 hypothetical protein AcV7_001533 [Antrodia cinnamomea]KAI0945458.1 hypothetical protein AcW1_001675 [Antrodia cinnamomea]
MAAESTAYDVNARIYHGYSNTSWPHPTSHAPTQELNGLRSAYPAVQARSQPQFLDNNSYMYQPYNNQYSQVTYPNYQYPMSATNHTRDTRTNRTPWSQGYGGYPDAYHLPSSHHQDPQALTTQFSDRNMGRSTVAAGGFFNAAAGFAEAAYSGHRNDRVVQGAPNSLHEEIKDPPLYGVPRGREGVPGAHQDASGSSSRVTHRQQRRLSHSPVAQRRAPWIPQPAPMSSAGIVADPVPRVPCEWSGCDVQLDDVSAAGIKRHMRDFHCPVPESWRGAKGPCQWAVLGGVCGRVLDHASFGKHIASVHLKSTAEQCPQCGNVIGRKDSLARHLQRHCPRRIQT